MMMAKDPTYYSRLYDRHGNIAKAAREAGVSPSTFRRRLAKERGNNVISSAISPARPRKRKGKRRYIVTAAQNDTAVFKPFLDNLHAYARHLNAELIVIPISYVFPKDRGKDKTWDQSVAHLLRNERIMVHDRLAVCGEMDIRPTAVSPLSGLDSYTKDAWGVFPHSKVALVSVPTPKSSPPKHIMTTGAVTVPNYIPRKTGLKAVFHHVYGAVIIEVDYDTDEFWVRHIHADENDGSFHDLSVQVRNGQIYHGVPVEAMVLGDIHIEKVDKQAVVQTINSIEYLRPRVVVLHDLVDFYAKNHHNRNNPVHNFHAHHSGVSSVAQCFEQAVSFVNALAELAEEVVVVPSNHHDSYRRWLVETDYREDPQNILFYLEEAKRYYETIAKADGWEEIDPFVLTMTERYKVSDRVRFLGHDADYKICDISVGYHGHTGANGARGSVRGFSKMSTKTMIGHTHQAQIVDGAYSVGALASLDMGYNKGPSSWSHTNGIIYASGARALLTRVNGAYYMDG